VSKLAELSPYVRETLALQDMLMSLGHDQDDLYVVFADNGIGMSILREEKQHPFPTALRPPELERDTFLAEWKAACAVWNESSQEDRHQLVETSDVRQRAVLIVNQLVALDLLPPQVLDFQCPFCGGLIQVNGTKSSVLHTLPTCSKFKNLDPTSFLKECHYAFDGN